MTLVPIRQRADRRRQWLAMDTWDADARTCVVLVDEADIHVYADRAALRIVTALRTIVRDASVVSDRVRLRIPTLNRVLNMPGSGCVVVCGPAPAVAAAQREVERFNAETRPAEVPPAPPIDRSEP